MVAGRVVVVVGCVAGVAELGACVVVGRGSGRVLAVVAGPGAAVVLVAEPAGGAVVTTGRPRRPPRSTKKRCTHQRQRSTTSQRRWSHDLPAPRRRRWSCWTVCSTLVGVLDVLDGVL
ncbi:MAG: hypothetical protein R2749_00935 [Acidimicrobiales bacterium]